nr:hypothetical protein GCM10020185_74690 [Pseudomonas brassicacearum subsp. brassicacearum]
MPQPGIKPAQVAIKVKVRPGLFKGTGDVLQAYPGDGQNHGLVILWRRVGLPYRFQTLLGANSRNAGHARLSGSVG